MSTQKQSNSKWHKVGSITKDEESGNFSVKLDETVPAGTRLAAFDVRKSWRRLVDMGKMTEDEYADKDNNLKWLRYELCINTEKQQVSKAPAKAQTKVGRITEEL